MLDDIDTFLALNSQKNLFPRPLNKTEQHNEVLFFFFKASFLKDVVYILLNESQGQSITQWLWKVNYSKGGSDSVQVCNLMKDSKVENLQ